MNIFNQFLVDVVNVAYPNLCLGCGTTLADNESSLCLNCLFQLAETGMHLTEPNEITNLFLNKSPIVHGCSYFKYIKEGLLQRLIHDLKYHNHPEIGVMLGKIAAQGLKKSNIFSDIDYIIPVPLHPKKFKIRGYNQSEKISQGLSQVLDIPIITNILIKTSYNETQTKKHRIERYFNSQNLFKVVDKSQYYNNHFLIVDDVLTTGATLESCINELKNILNAKVSVFTLARAIG